MSQNEKIKKPFYKKWWVWVVAVIIIAGIGGNMNKDNPKKVGETNTTVVDKKDDSKKVEETGAKPKDNETQSNQSKTFKVGDIVGLKDLKVTVNKVYKVKGNEFSKPKDGNEFIAVDCTVENISKEEQAVSSIAMFKVVDKDGRACEYSMTGQVAANAGQMDGQIAPGRKLTGVYVVEVPKGTKGLELEFDSSFLLGGQVVVKLN